VCIRTKHAAAQAWLLLWRRGSFARRTTLAPRSDRDSIDFFVYGRGGIRVEAVADLSRIEE
jgi:hypothetical protein